MTGELDDIFASVGARRAEAGDQSFVDDLPFMLKVPEVGRPILGPLQGTKLSRVEDLIDDTDSFAPRYTDDGDASTTGSCGYGTYRVATVRDMLHEWY